MKEDFVTDVQILSFLSSIVRFIVSGATLEPFCPVNDASINASSLGYLGEPASSEEILNAPKSSSVLLITNASVSWISVPE